MPGRQKSNPERQQPSGDQQALAIVGAVVGALAGIVGIIIGLVAAGWFVVGICLVVLGVVLCGIVAAYWIARTDWYRRRSKRLGLYLLFAVGALLLVAGIPALILGHPSGATKPPADTECSQRAQVSGGDTSASSFTITVKLACLQPTGNQLWLMSQLLNEGVAGTEKHSEYIFSNAVRDTLQSQPFSHTPSGCVNRRYYLISVTPDQLAFLQASMRTSGGAYYGNPIDDEIGKYIVSNTQNNRTCNK